MGPHSSTVLQIFQQSYYTQGATSTQEEWLHGSTLGLLWTERVPSKAAAGPCTQTRPSSPQKGIHFKLAPGLEHLTFDQKQGEQSHRITTVQVHCLAVSRNEEFHAKGIREKQMIFATQIFATKY